MSRSASRGTRFTDQTDAFNLPRSSLSFGAAFGDANKDGFPDLYLGFHYTGVHYDRWPNQLKEPTIFVNENGMRFTPHILRAMPRVGNGIEFDCTGPCLTIARSGDFHGSAWHDFDGDGDQDLFIATGGQGGVGGTPCLLIENLGDAGFVNRAADLGAQLSELRARVVIWLDWDGDGLSDLLVTAQPAPGEPPASQAVILQQTRSGESEHDVGNITFVPVAHGVMALARLQPSPQGSEPRSLVIIPEGTLSRATDKRQDSCMLYCREWYTAQPNCCVFRSEVQSHSSLASVHDEGDLNRQLERSGVISDVFGKRWINGLNGPHGRNGTFPGSVATGDFDNDGDNDVFVVLFLEDRQACANGSRTSRPNILLENLGDDGGRVRFRMVHDGWGLSDRPTYGNGDAVAMADVNGDGFLDLFVTHGAGINYAPGTGRSADADRKAGTYDIHEHQFTQGPNQLFINAANNGNHWLKVRLIGLVTEGSSIGTRVTVRAGGHEQVRFKLGGNNLMSQNYHELHFGLGAFEECAVTALWPSGRVHEMFKVKSDQTITFDEAYAIQPAAGRDTVQNRVVPTFACSGSKLQSTLWPGPWPCSRSPGPAARQSG